MGRWSYRLQDGAVMLLHPSLVRERAARALCPFHGVPENTTFEGRPMWQSYLPEVEVILTAIGFDDKDFNSDRKID